ncbi:MAG: tetratricopeptide repeat protein [Salinivirgaceae bacterium]
MQNYKHRFLSVFFILLTLGVNANSIDSLKNVISKSPDAKHFELWIQVGLHYREGGNFDSAQIAFRNARSMAINDSLKAVYWHNQGGLNWRFGNYHQAIAFYDSAIDARMQIGLHNQANKSKYYLTLVYRDLSQYGKAIDLAKSLITPNTNGGDSAMLADIYNHLGSIFLRLHNYDSANFWYEQAIDIRFAMKDSLKMADSYSNMGKIAREQGVYTDAIAHYKKALQFYITLNEKDKVAYTYLLLGGTYWQAKKYQEALQEYLISMRLYESLGRKQQVASAQKNIGLIYRDIGNIDKAVEYHMRSLDTYREIGNKPLIGVAVSILAGDYWSAGNYNQALSTYLKALDIRKELGNKSHIAGGYNNVALAYKSLEMQDSSMINYRRALTLYREIDDRRNEAAILNNIGNLHKRDSVNDSAVHYLQKALELRKRIEHRQGIGYSSLNLGQVYWTEKQGRKSEKILLEARTIARELSDDYLLKESCLLLSDIYQKTGRYQKSLTFYQEFHAAEKRLQVDESIRRVADMQIRFEAEKRMRIVEKKDAELKQQAMRIYYLLAGLALLLVLVVVVIIALLQKRKSNRLLAMRNMEIQEQKAEIEAQRDLAEDQRDTIAAQNDKINDSILYASRIQNALLPPDDQMEGLLKQHFIFFKPKDVVSGDFYYFQNYKQYTVIAAADCTGHGVPGAFMSMLGISLLNEIMASEQIDNAADVLQILRDKVMKNLHQTSVRDGNSDGMDISLIMLNRETQELHFAGANNPLVVVRNNELMAYDGDRMPIGVHIHSDHFKNNEIKVQRGDKLYMYSDGFVDQFGGKTGRKLMSKNFKKLLLETSKFDMPEQKSRLNTFFEKWKGNNRQIDDIVIIGLEI